MFWRALCLITALNSLESSAIRWPAGTYGIPKPVSGCPPDEGFRWKKGWILQDTSNYYDHDSNNSRSTLFHIDGFVNKVFVNRSFCIKVTTTDDEYRSAWPAGKYCIYQKYEKCPKGLKPGNVFWNDEDSSFNSNQQDGASPDFMILNDRYTMIYFCCKTDGDKNNPVLLPSYSPFFLLAYNSSTCQMVKWAIASLEWIYFSTSNDDNEDSAEGAFPYHAGKKHPTMYYCFYRGCNETLRSSNGTLQSPFYPEKYPNGQYCSWRIAVHYSQQVHLKFTTFELQNEEDTDELYVYDGENERQYLLGVFYGNHPPPREGILSSWNSMFLIFKSDDNDSYSGFNAFYRAVNRISPTATNIISIPSGQEVTPGTTRWPAGAYGLTKPVSGCPSAEGFRWKEGWILQDTSYYNDHDKSNNSRSTLFHLDGFVEKFIVNRSFCIKDRTTDDKNRQDWPAGKYCIYKRGSHCPKGLKKGFVFWNDDDDDEYNGDKHGGELPDFFLYYEKYTEIRFCCKTNGEKNTPILLPTEFPFFLLAYESAKCQMVKWAVSSLEWIYFSTSNFDNDDLVGGAFPYDAGKKHPTVYYCYYHGCNKTLMSNSGTIKSPGYPKNYANGQYCSWRILTHYPLRIYLKFSTFDLQREKNTDELYVYDGETESWPLLGVFNGNHTPPEEGILSSWNSMFLIFKSDDTDSHTGFSAFYRVVSDIPSSTTTTISPHREVAPSPEVSTISFKTPKMTSSSAAVTSFRTSNVNTTASRTSDHEVTASPKVSSTSLKILEMTSSSVVVTSSRASVVKTTMSRTSGREVTLLPGITSTTSDAQELTSSKVGSVTFKTSSVTTTLPHPPEVLPPPEVIFPQHKSTEPPGVRSSYFAFTTTAQFDKITFSSAVCCKTSQTPEGMNQPTPAISEVFHSLAKTTVEPPFRESDTEKVTKHKSEGVNLVAVVVPVVFIVGLASVLIGAFFYWKRKRRRENEGSDDSVCLRMDSESVPFVLSTEL